LGTGEAALQASEAIVGRAAILAARRPPGQGAAALGALGALGRGRIGAWGIGGGEGRGRGRRV